MPAATAWMMLATTLGGIDLTTMMPPRPTIVKLRTASTSYDFLQGLGQTLTRPDATTTAHVLESVQMVTKSVPRMPSVATGVVMVNLRGSERPLTKRMAPFVRLTTTELARPLGSKTKRSSTTVDRAPMFRFELSRNLSSVALFAPVVMTSLPQTPSPA